MPMKTQWPAVFKCSNTAGVRHVMAAIDGGLVDYPQGNPLEVPQPRDPAMADTSKAAVRRRPVELPPYAVVKLLAVVAAPSDAGPAGM